MPDAQNLKEALAYYDRWLAFNQRYLRVPGSQAAVLYSPPRQPDQGPAEDKIIDSTAPDPTTEPIALEVDGDVLRVTNNSGAFGALPPHTFDSSGAVESVCGSGGMLGWPLDEFTLPGRVRVNG